MLREQLLTRQSDDNLYVVTTESNDFLGGTQTELNMNGSSTMKKVISKKPSQDSALLKAYQDNNLLKEEKALSKYSVRRLSSGR